MRIRGFVTANRLGGLFSRRTLALSAAALTALATHLASCSFINDGKVFEDGVCGEGFKACDTGCVSTTDSRVGCNGPGCLPCVIPNALTTQCSDAGLGCIILRCEPNYAHCSSDPGDGCEVDLAHDPLNCGECGCRCGTGDSTQCSMGQNVAPIAHGQPGCTSPHTCTVRSCDRGWGDCNGDPSDGCETPTDGGSACGACGTTCMAPFECVCTDTDAGILCGCEAPDGATP
jgi:hypothetical protein